MSLGIMTLQTPARVDAVVESETELGGRTFSLSLTGTVWGDFRPDEPATASGGEGDAYVVQAAEFVCRRAEFAVGSRLRIRGLDWVVLSLDERPDEAVRVRIERVHL